jgi:hypothetical protein
VKGERRERGERERKKRKKKKKERERKKEKVLRKGRSRKYITLGFSFLRQYFIYCPGLAFNS